MHPAEGERAWSESYYFNCYDPVTDCGFFTRIGVRPNEGTIDVWLSLWLPDGRLAHLGPVREQHEMIDCGLTVGGLTYDNEHLVNADAAHNNQGQPARMSLWEIHPVTEFFVCDSGSCDPARHSDWMTLTDWANKHPR